MIKHEDATANFYGTGVEKFNGFHNYFLNFGLWEDGITDYVKASERLLTRLANAINLNSESHLLDVACGMGSQDLFWMQTFNCQKIDALDLTRKHLDIAKQHHKHDRIQYHHGNACILPFPDNYFTHVTGVEGPANFNTREDFFYEAFRSLKPGGKLGLADYCLPPRPIGWLERKLVEWVAHFWHVPAANINSAETYQKKLEKAGFVNINIEVVSKDVIPPYVAEHRRPEVKKELNRIRGPLYGRLSCVLDTGVELLYNHKLLDYILVSAKKP